MKFKNLLLKPKLINLLFFVVFASCWIMGQMQRVEFSLILGGREFNLPFYVMDVVLGLWLVFVSLSQRKSWLNLLAKFNWKKHLLLLLLGGWIILGWVGALMMGNFNLRALFYVVRFGVYGLLGWSVWRWKLVDQKILRLGFFSAGILLLIWGLMQYWLLPDVRFLQLFGWDDHMYRLVATQFDPNFMGILLVVLFVFLQFFEEKAEFVFLKKEKIKVSDKNLLVTGRLIKNFCLSLILLTLALTFSRASYLSFVMAEVLVFLFSLGKGLKKIDLLNPFFLVLLLLCLIWIVPKPGGEGVDLTRTASVMARVESSRNLFEVWDGRTLLMGQGLFMGQKSGLSIDRGIPLPDHAYLPDNLLITLVNWLGLGGVLILLFMIGREVMELQKSNQLKLFSPILISLIAVLVHSMFNSTLFQPFVFLYLGWGFLVFETDR